MSDSLPTNTGKTPDIESVKLTLTGSPRAISSVIQALHCFRFAEVNDWSRPQPTKNSNEVISVLIRRISLD